MYFISGKLGLRLAFVNASATAVWAPTGIALAAFLLLGYRVWPGIFLGAFFVNMLTAGSFITTLAIAAGNTLEGLAGACLVARFANGRDFVYRAQDIFKFAVLAAMASTMVSATIGVTALSLAGFADWANYGRIWLTWWLGDAAGDILAAPFFILWLSDPRIQWTRDKMLEAVSLLAALVIVGLIVFGGWLPAGMKNYPIDFTCVPLFIWAAFRFGKRETATLSILLSAIAIWGTLHGFGPFRGKTPNESLLLLQTFMGVTAITALTLVAIVSQERRAKQSLWTEHQHLEQRVVQRTAALSRANDTLQCEIIERARIEEELRGRTEELMHANDELTLFASIVSHELQEPLRKILAFGDLLKLGAALHKEEAQYAQRMQDAAKRMQQLVEDIMSLCRVTTSAKPLEKVDLNEILREIVSDFSARMTQSGGKIDVGPMPALRADGIQMRQLLGNLISNAYKFRKKDEPLRVIVSCRRPPKGGAVEIIVADNGIGFEEQYVDRIFKPFQRLHRKSDYEGNGMGLAICERIVMRHGGKITAKSLPGEGSSFIVTLPA